MNDARFRAALARFDEENSKDPNREAVQGRDEPRELLYARRLTDWVLRLDPGASEPLQLAARCQHLCRWMIPRSTYPMTRAGYHRWRTDLKAFHAERSESILRECGYSDEVIDRVRDLNLKRSKDGDGQTLEDALCLVFLEYQLHDFAEKTEDQKVVNALRKAWEKMSDAGRAAALNLDYGPRAQSLIGRAVSGED